jgi:hypothetical protein
MLHFYHCVHAGTPYPTPEGWELQAILNVTGRYAGQAAQVPVGAVLKPTDNTKGPKQLMVVLRGAAFNGDNVYGELLLLLLLLLAPLLSARGDTCYYKA